MTLRHAALSSLFVLLTAACSDPGSVGGTGRGGAGGSGQSGGSSGSGKGGSNTGGSGGSNTGGTTGTGGSTGGSGGSSTGGTAGTTGTGGASGSGGSGTGGASGTGGSGTGGTGGSSGAGTGGAGTGGTAGTGGAAGTGGTAGTGSAGTGGTGGIVDAGGKDGTAGTAGSAGSAGKDAGAGGGTVDAAPPPPVDGGPAIPPPNGTCPNFVTGDVNFTPAVGGTRKVAITMGASKAGGPLIVYWHSTGNNPTEATRTGGALPVSAVSAAGGIIAAPYDSYTDQFPWTMHFTDHDALFDEIIACAAQKTTVSPARIHALGFSAGALMTTHLSFARSKSLASVAAYSGGQQGTAQFQEMNNKFPAMVITGGTGDFAFIDFYVPSQTWQTTLKSAGHFAMFCDHGGGHRIPASTVVGGVFQFFMDHPYGTNPSPYAGGKIPSAISICKE